MVDLSQIRIFRMTHIANVPHILAHGITHISSPNANPAYQPIGDGTLIASRANFPVGLMKTLGHYTPFYFWGHMPMLYVIQKGFNGVKPVAPADIVYLVSSVGRIVDTKLPFIFTSGHAFHKFSMPFRYPNEVIDIENIVDFGAVKEPNWKKEDDQDLKRRKEAEFLVEGDIPLAAIAGYCVYDDTARQKLLALGIAENRVIIKKDFYF